LALTERQTYTNAASKKNKAGNVRIMYYPGVLAQTLLPWKHNNALLRIVDVNAVRKGKGTVHPITDHEGPEGE